MPSFNRLTEAADALLAGGMTDIYSDNKRALEMELRQEEKEAGAAAPTGPSSAAAASGPSSAASASASAPAAAAAAKTNKQWRYRWVADDIAPTSDSNGAPAAAAAADGGGEEFGPFTSAQMATWRAAGYFSMPVPGKRLQVIEHTSATTAAAAPAPASAGGGKDDDSDDDIFGGAGRLSNASAAAQQQPHWTSVEAVEF
jgi:hypothetical protein